MKIHVHTKYSLLDAIIEPEELVKKIIEIGDDAICVTDHGNMYGDVEIYKCCKKYGVKYLYGCEMYICDDVEEKNKNSKYYHLVVIAKNETGRINLNELISQSVHHKYYGKPRIDFKMLEQYHEGLLVCSACMAGEIQRALNGNDFSLAESIVNKYVGLFGDDYYLEYQSHSEEIQQTLNRKVVDLANKCNVKYIVTTDAHYLNKDDQKYHSIFVQIGSTREVGETYNDCYLQSDSEIMEICKSTTYEENKKALDTTNEIRDKCDVELPLSAPIIPHSTNLPEKFNTEIDFLKYLCAKGIKKKRIMEKPNWEEYKKRLQYEFNAIKKMGFEGYYLFVWSYVNSVTRRGIARGSAGGSLVAYLCDIVDIDPIEYGLYFERFIDVGALDLLESGAITKKELKIPDVDTDFGKADREKVLQHVINQYGADKVCNLGIFQYIRAKGAIKDIGKVLGIPFEITNKMTSQFEDETIQEVLDLGLLDEYKKEYPELFVYVKKLSGLPKSFGSHPCGKVACVDKITYYNPIDIGKDGSVILQGDMHTADDLGLTKADFLGVRTLDVVYDTLDKIGKTYDYISPRNIDLHDEQVYEWFRKGYTAGVFQFESHGMKDTLKKIEADSINDLTVANALYRPGSKKYIDNYARRKAGIETFEYIHNDLEPILKNTYGIIIFQEQLIEVGRLAKLKNPDELRKATAKKKASLLEKLKPELFDGLKNRGWSDNQVEQLWNDMIDFAKYSFNKSHAAAYALLAYICMYLKVHHQLEFCCSWLNSILDKPEKIRECIPEIIRMDIPLYIGKYNNCCSICTEYKNGIMIGTKLIKECNAKIAEELLNISQNNIYTNFVKLLIDIKEKTSVNARQLEILTALNFFSDFGSNEKLLKIEQLYDDLYNVKQIKKDKLEELGLNEFLMQKYAGKETAKLYKDINTKGLLQELVSKIPDTQMSVIKQMKFEKEHLEYIDYTLPEVSPDVYIVTDFIQYSDASKPRLTARRVCDGEEIKVRIKQSKIFKEQPFGLWSILRIPEFTKEYKKKPNASGEWVETDEMEDILYTYEVIAEI